MRRLLPLALALGLLATAPAAAATPSLSRVLRSGNALVALQGGRGTVVLSGSGTVWGWKVRRGSIRIVDVRGGSPTDVVVKGYEHVKRKGSRTKVYTGRGMTFSVAHGRWRVRVRGRGINASAAMRGILVLKGRAGTYALNGGAAHDWPRTRRVFRLR